MSDIKLFKLTSGVVAEISSQSAQVEKSLQSLFESSLDALLGVRFLATEYSTGAVHGGRIDTLGLDEDGSPVIIEYKRSVNENVINQGLFYLDWLLDHKKEFQWLVMEELGAELAARVDWSTPRLICIAGDFTKYDGYAVKQIARNIELLRYRRFGDDLLVIELVHSAASAKSTPITSVSTTPQSTPPHDGGRPSKDPYLSQRIDYRISQSPQDLRDLFEATRDFIKSLGDDVQEKQVQNYIAFKGIKNFVCLEIYPQARVVTTFVKVDPGSVLIESGFSRDVSKVGHFGTGDLELSLKSMDDLSKAMPLFQRAYEGS